MNELSKIGLLAAIVIGLSEAVKAAGMPLRFVPFANIASGVAVSLIMDEFNLKYNIIIGLIAGLTASGLFSDFQSVVQSVRNKNPDKQR